MNNIRGKKEECWIIYVCDQFVSNSPGFSRGLQCWNVIPWPNPIPGFTNCNSAMYLNPSNVKQLLSSEKSSAKFLYAVISMRRHIKCPNLAVMKLQFSGSFLVYSISISSCFITSCSISPFSPIVLTFSFIWLVHCFSCTWFGNCCYVFILLVNDYI